MPVNGPVNGVACGVVGRPADGGRDLRVPASIPCYSHHRGSKFNARSRRRPAAPSAPQACSLQAPYGFPSEGFHSGGPKHSQGLKLSKLPKWRTVPYDTDSREAKVHRKTGAPLRSWDRVSWEHAALDLRHHRRRALQPQRSLTDRRNLAREAAWNGAHAVTVSEKNSAVPRSCRSYFRDPKELGLNGTIMGTRPSGVWKTLRRPGSPSIEDRVAVGGLSLYGRDVVAVPGSLERPSRPLRRVRGRRAAHGRVPQAEPEAAAEDRAQPLRDGQPRGLPRRLVHHEFGVPLLAGLPRREVKDRGATVL